jgi:hypothetical protein
MVVVRTGLVAFEHVFGTAPGSEHQDGKEIIQGTISLHDFETVNAREHLIEHNRVELLRLDELQSFLAGVRDRGVETLGFKIELYSLGDMLFVFNY